MILVFLEQVVSVQSQFYFWSKVTEQTRLLHFR